jgi:DNA (cytosine-5)-methyltransferase 1
MLERPATDKPPYRVSSMEQIAAIPWNGYSCASSFSGCGGSSLGYKMAGFRVLWANEFIPAAQDTYRANHPDTLLDTRDIRIVRPEELLEAIGMRARELDLFDGSPPCASFSTAGKREEGWGKVKQYSDTKQRTDDLFFEYVRLVKGVQPKVFVAENVSGLVKGTAKGYFKEILQALKDCGYNVKARLLDAQWLGVPQMRQRIIFIGVRNDLDIEPAFPSPLPYRYSVRDALPWIEQIEGANGFNGHAFAPSAQPNGTVQQSRSLSVIAIRQGNKNGHSSQRGDIVELAAPAPTIIAGGGSGQFEVEEETDISRYAIGREWEKLKQGENSHKYQTLYRAHIDHPAPMATASGGMLSKASATHPTEKRKFSIAELKRICAFPDDFALTGTYAQQWERLGRAVPPVMMSHIAIAIRDHVLCKIT